KAANALLLDLQRQKDDFIAQVRHEGRTPRTSIRSFAEILLTGDDLTAAQRERFMTSIHNESVRLTRRLGDIRGLSPPEQGERAWRARLGERSRRRGGRARTGPDGLRGAGEKARGHPGGRAASG